MRFAVREVSLMAMGTMVCCYTEHLYFKIELHKCDDCCLQKYQQQAPLEKLGGNNLLAEADI